MFCIVHKTPLPVVVLLCLFYTATAQFAPQADLPGTTAIAGDSSVFVDWANSCTVQRGPVNIADTSLGLATAGVTANALGVADAVTVSLGDGGTATLTFNHPIYNGAGPDFAVFENGFMANDSNLAFLELGFVEVSTDGIRYVRFPSISNVQDTAQTGSFGVTDCSQLYNLAGKYIANYGTPFDLQELVDSPGIDVNNINYVKVIDVVGSIDTIYATYDHNGHIVNDPWPTPYASCGFDLDAVGVINSKSTSSISEIAQTGALNIYPNPVEQGNEVHIQLPLNIYSLKLFNLNGQLIQEWNQNNAVPVISTGKLSSGMYFMRAETGHARFNTKLIVQ